MDKHEKTDERRLISGQRKERTKLSGVDRNGIKLMMVNRGHFLTPNFKGLETNNY